VPRKKNGHTAVPAGKEFQAALTHSRMEKSSPGKAYPPSAAFGSQVLSVKVNPWPPRRFIFP
jgi:hypothetical protein